MAASLWVRRLESFGPRSMFKDTNLRQTCPTCKSKMSKSNPFVYSVGKYVCGKRRNIINQVCRNCWDLETRRCVTPAGHRASLRCDHRPHWMDMPLTEPRLTVDERWLLDELCQFDIMPGQFEVVAYATGYEPVDDKAFTDCLYVRTRDIQIDEDEFRSHPLRDWCEENGIVIEESYTGAGMPQNPIRYHVGFCLPRRDGQPHNNDNPVCPLCNDPVLPGERTDEASYGTVHHNCQEEAVSMS